MIETIFVVCRGFCDNRDGIYCISQKCVYSSQFCKYFIISFHVTTLGRNLTLLQCKIVSLQLV